MIRNTTESWGALAKFFHWITALLVVVQIALGWMAVAWRFSPFKADLYVWHKSFGMLTLSVVVLRLLWRLSKPIPLLPADVPRWEQRCARTSFLLLYALLIAMPISGWVLNSTLNIPVLLFWLIPLPDVTAPSERVADIASAAHFAMLVLLSALLLLHIAAALRHHYMRRNHVLTRMLPKARRGPALGLALFFLLVLTTAPHGDAAEWTVDQRESTIQFIARFEKAPAPGVFKDFDVRVQLHPEDSRHDRLDVKIAVNSVDMSSASFNRAIRGAEWFDPAQFPHAEFYATQVRRLDGGRYIARGMLSLKGIRHPVDVPFVWTDDGDAAFLQGEVKVDRTLFGIGSGEWMASHVVGREVSVKFAVKLRRTG